MSKGRGSGLLKGIGAAGSEGGGERIAIGSCKPGGRQYLTALAKSFILYKLYRISYFLHLYIFPVKSLFFFFHYLSKLCKLYSGKRSIGETFNSMKRKKNANGWQIITKF